jgi:nucleotide-binding universal stress UspA family protein
MIRAITVRAGSSKYTVAAQAHAIRLAQWFHSRLRVVVAWNGKDTGQESEQRTGRKPEDIAGPDADELMERARRAGLCVDEGFRGEGSLEGLLAESRATDLLVLGFPTEREAESDKFAGHLLHRELPVLRKSECSVLVVRKEPAELKNILVVYEGGVENKSALRTAAHIAEKARAGVHILTRKGRREEATILAAAARKYMENYCVETVKSIDDVGDGASRSEILRVAGEIRAGLIVLGTEPYGLMKLLFDFPVAEETVLDSLIPVLVAR